VNQSVTEESKYTQHSISIKKVLQRLKQESNQEELKAQDKSSPEKSSPEVEALEEDSSHVLVERFRKFSDRDAGSFKAV
jgi:mRNA deadenylase 3'-5' endonuclease subunit Ccr4